MQIEEIRLDGNAAAEALREIFSQEMTVAVATFAAGGLLAMLTESIIPESFADAQPFTGLITVTGFLVAFLIIKA